MQSVVLSIFFDIVKILVTEKSFPHYWEEKLYLRADYVEAGHVVFSSSAQLEKTLS